MSTDVNLRILLSASSGNVQSVVSGIARAFGSGSGGLGGVLAGVGVLGVGALVKLGMVSMDVSDQFQTAMLQDEAHAGLVASQVGVVTDSLMKMGPAVGQGPVELAKALYPILSGFSSITDQSAKTQVSLQTLRDATESVAGTTTDATVVSKAMVSTFNAYNMESNNTAQNLKNINSLSDIMNQTVSEGNMKWDEYSRMVGNFMAKAAQAKVPITQANAALAVFTNSGESTQLAGTHLGALFQMLGTGANTLAKRFDKLGGSSGKTAPYSAMEKHLKLVGGKLIEVTSLVHHAGTSWKTLGEQFDLTKFKSMDLTDKVAYLEKITGGDSGKLQAILGNKTLVTTFQKLIAHGKDYQKTLEDLNHAQGATGTAFGTAAQGSEFKWKQMQAAAQALGITVGNELRPVLDKLLDSVTPLILKFTDWFSHSKEVQVIIQDISNFIQWTFSNVLVGLVTDITNLVTWLNNGSAPANAVKIGLEGIGVAILGIKLRGMITDMIDFGKSAMDFVQNIGPKMVNMLTGSNGIAGAANTASDAEKAVGVTAKTTMATDVAEGSLAAEGSLGKVGAEATATEGEVAGASAGMKTSLLGMLPVIGTVFFGFMQLRDMIGSMKLPGGLTTDQAASAMQKGLPGGFNPWPFGHASGGFINPGDVGLVGERGPEFISGGSRGITVTSTSASAALLRSGSMGGGHTFNFTGDININAPGGDPRDMAKQFLDEVEREQALRFRLQTSGYASAGVF